MRAASITTILCLALSRLPGLAQAPDKAAPPLMIVEATASKEIKWTDVKTPAIAVPLTIENVDKKALTNIGIEVTPFSGSGRMAAVLVDGKTSPVLIKSIEAGHRTTVMISADLPAAVTYRAYVGLRVADKT